jgi:hypothetical protein
MIKITTYSFRSWQSARAPQSEYRDEKPAKWLQFWAPQDRENPNLGKPRRSQFIGPLCGSYDIELIRRIAIGNLGSCA